MKLFRMTFFLLAILAIPVLSSAQQPNTFILESPSLTQAQAACQRYGLTLLSVIHAPDTYLVQASDGVDPKSLAEWTKDDPDVKHVEPNTKVKQGKSKGPGPVLVAPPPTSTYLTDPRLISLYGTSALTAYVMQPAYYSTPTYTAGVKAGLNGTGVVAVIDTGVDAQNPILAPVVVPGFDFISNQPGYASDVSDLDQSTAHILHQSTAHILHQSTAHILHQLNPSAAAALDANTANALANVNLPNDFGHGTMVAGLIHLVAPKAKIMPLKAFTANGNAQQADIIRAIYFAADNGASIINMSFGFPTISDAHESYQLRESQGSYLHRVGGER
jgi:hypothetical protein